MTPYSFVTIDCPDTGRPITVAKNTRDDPIGQLYVTNRISQHQRAAAEAYQHDVEALSGNLRAPSRGPADVAGWRARRPDGRNRKHRNRVARADAALGPDQAALLQGALAGRRVDARKLGHALDVLAVVYGFATATKH